jgi:hypothetical protein
LKILLDQAELLSLFGEGGQTNLGQCKPLLSHSLPAVPTGDASPTQVSLKATVPERATPIGTSEIMAADPDLLPASLD